MFTRKPIIARQLDHDFRMAPLVFGSKHGTVRTLRTVRLRYICVVNQSKSLLSFFS